MKCFYSPEQDAVGLCKHCARALCLDCHAEIQGLLACKGHCEAEVQLIHDTEQSRRQVLGRVGSDTRVQSTLQLTGGVVLIALTPLLWTFGKQFPAYSIAAYVMAVSGLIVIGLAIRNFKISRERFPR